MKNIIIGVRLCLTFVLISPSIYANAQIFDPSTIWYTCSRDITSNIPGSCVKFMLESSYYSGDTLISVFKSFPGYVIRQIKDKVYFNDELKYDFGLNVGDTIMIPVRRKEELIPFILDSSATEFILGKNRKAMYIRGIISDSIFFYYKLISGVGGASYIKFTKPDLNRFTFDYYQNYNFIFDILQETSYIKIDNQLNRLSDCSTCDQLVPTKEESLAEINIQPNPVTDYLHVNTSSPIKRYEVYNLSGQILLTDAINTSDTQYTVDVSTLAKGLYFAKINFSGGGNKVFKFLKK